MKDLKFQMLQMQQTQNLLLKNIMSKTCPPPHTSPESKPISSTNVLNMTCPNLHSVYQFLFMNIARLLSSKLKHKLKFLTHICDANTRILCFVKLFHDSIGYCEIQISAFLLPDVIVCLGLGDISIYMKKIC